MSENLYEDASGGPPLICVSRYVGPAGIGSRGRYQIEVTGIDGKPDSFVHLRARDVPRLIRALSDPAVFDSVRDDLKRDRRTERAP